MAGENPYGYIEIHGARVHNLKNIDLRIPRGRLVVISGLSGSGKSSLAFDTLFAEGQRRYMESLSSYARQFLSSMEAPDVDEITGLSPAIAIEQKTKSSNPRSTVCTVTSIYDYYRLLFARCGTPHCPKCGREIKEQTVDQITQSILAMPQGSKIQILAPVIKGQKGEHKKLLQDAIALGFVRARVDGVMVTLDNTIALDKQKKHTIELIIDRIIVKDESKARITDAVEAALQKSNGVLLVLHDDKEDFYSQKCACPVCGVSIPELSPRLFSFNNPYGACPDCTGLGEKQSFDIDLIIPDYSLSFNNGGIAPYTPSAAWNACRIKALAQKDGWNLDEPLSCLTQIQKERLIYGTQDTLHWTYQKMSGGVIEYNQPWPGLLSDMKRRYVEAWGDGMKENLEKYMTHTACPTCKGKRLRPEVLGVTVGDVNIWELCKKDVTQSIDFFEHLQLNDFNKQIANRVITQITSRLNFLKDVGLEYLCLDRSAGTLSGGEAQRIRLATQVGQALTGVMYVLDEPSIGLHQRDNERLLQTLKHLRDIGNSVIVVEHDEQTLKQADYLVDIGEKAGVHGGRVVAAGTPMEVAKVEKSLTGQYLRGQLYMPIKSLRRSGNGHILTIKGAFEHNLKDIDVSIKLGTFTCITGVSGSGKSTLLNYILYPALSSKLMHSKLQAKGFKSIQGYEALDKVINIDQSPIGRTPRSNPVTYVGAFDAIRKLYAELPLAKAKGYNAGRFSFNVAGGRCEKCQGAGTLTIQMNFLPDVYVTCDSCGGKRFNQETLEIEYRGKNINDVLCMTIEEATDFFSVHKGIYRKLKTLCDVGLGYITLGQSALTLSGGEAQRVKLSSELSRVSTGKTLYILDEPTTGLHFYDIMQLMKVIDALVDQGNTVLMIEHNLDVIAQADNIIDLGPEGGNKGGNIVFCGTPEEIAQCDASWTGRFLRQTLQQAKAHIT